MFIISAFLTFCLLIIKLYQQISIGFDGFLSEGLTSVNQVSAIALGNMIGIGIVTTLSLGLVLIGPLVIYLYFG